MEVIFDSTTAAPRRLERCDEGYFEGTAAGSAGLLYRYRIDGRGPYPDPCSRYQPQGPEGPSMVVDPHAYAWRDGGWPGIQMRGQVLYELHVGAFTPAGTFDAAARELRHLAELGVTCIELLPIGEFPGGFNWGYDAVNLYAPFHGYGAYDAFKRFVDAAHGLGIGVILDVVYNHVGNEANYLACFSADYFTDRYPNDWGQSINFDGPGCEPVREFFIENATYWVREFHLDGLRLDATQSIHDSSWPHVMVEITERTRAAAAPRSIILIAENEPQDSQMLAPIEAAGFGLDALWNDDFHHAARVALTGSHDGYFGDYRGSAQELLSVTRHNFLFQGQRSSWQKKSRGSPALDLPAWSFVTFTQNHDQVANTGYGRRLHELTSPGRYRAMTALLLLAPQTPMLFMGQEFNTSAPFAYFADHAGELAEQVRQGRRKFMRQFKHYATPHAQEQLLDPAAGDTFERSKLDWSERERHASILNLHRDLLRLRREDPVISQQDRERIDGAVLGEGAFVLRWFDAEHGDRLLLVNLKTQRELNPTPEPLLAPPRGAGWKQIWSSDDPRYDGPGDLALHTDGSWELSAESATFLAASRS